MDYRRNSAKSARPKIAEIKKRHKVGLNNETNDKKMSIIEVVPKICATNECVWCGVKFEDYEIRCRVCGNCQFCGRLCPGRNGCRQCGNYKPEDIRSNGIKPSIIIQTKRN